MAPGDVKHGPPPDRRSPNARGHSSHASGVVANTRANKKAGLDPQTPTGSSSGPRSSAPGRTHPTNACSKLRFARPEVSITVPAVKAGRDHQVGPSPLLASRTISPGSQPHSCSLQPRRVDDPVDRARSRTSSRTSRCRQAGANSGRPLIAGNDLPITPTLMTPITNPAAAPHSGESSRGSVRASVSPHSIEIARWTTTPRPNPGRPGGTSVPTARVVS